MIQEILTYIIIAATVLIVVWRIVSPRTGKRGKKKNDAMCAGCPLTEKCGKDECTRDNNVSGNCACH